MKKRLLTLFFLLAFLCPAFATTTITKTVAQSGGDYTNLDAAIDYFTANYPDFQAADIKGVINITGAWSAADSVAAEIPNYNSDSTHTLLIQTVGASRHDGTLNKAGAYHRSANLQIGATGGSANYVTIDGIACDSGKGVIYAGYAYIDHCYIKNCITWWFILPTYGYASTVYYYTNIFRTTNTDNYSDCFSFDSGATAYVENNTFIGNNAGNVLVAYTHGANTYLKNNIIINPGSGRSCVAGTPHADSDYNLTSDASAPGAHSQKSKTLTFKNAAGGDYHLAATDTDAIGKGVDLSTDFTTDIDGDTWVTWGIGADYYTAPASSASNPLELSGD